MEERLLDKTTPSEVDNNATKEEHNVLHGLSFNPSIVVKVADKGSVEVVWDREGYLKEAYKQHKDRELYEEVTNDLSVLLNSRVKALEKIHMRGDFSSDILNHSFVEDPKFARSSPCIYLQFISVYTIRWDQ